jgi:hypothetical protein
MPDESGSPPSIPYWHLWTDADGVSHHALCHLTDFEFKGVGDASPQWNNKHARSEATVVVTVQPVGWVGEWHENPAPQWIVVLSGRWWIEAMDGTRIEQGPGEFSLGEDQGCVAREGKRGHRSGTIGDVPAVLMCVQRHVEPQRTPCHQT